MGIWKLAPRHRSVLACTSPQGLNCRVGIPPFKDIGERCVVVGPELAHAPRKARLWPNFEWRNANSTAAWAEPWPNFEWRNVNSTIASAGPRASPLQLQRHTREAPPIWLPGVGGQAQPGATRTSQERPGATRRSQVQPGVATRSQEQPGVATRSQEQRLSRRLPPGRTGARKRSIGICPLRCFSHACARLETQS